MDAQARVARGSDSTATREGAVQPPAAWASLPTSCSRPQCYGVWSQTDRGDLSVSYLTQKKNKCSCMCECDQFSRPRPFCPPFLHPLW